MSRRDADTRSNLAEALLHEGKYSEAEAEHRQVLKLEEKVLGPEHPTKPVCAAAGAYWFLAPLLLIS